MIIFNEKILLDHGIELKQTKTGFTLRGVETVSQEILGALHRASAGLGLGDGDYERLVEFAVDLGLWSAIKAASETTDHSC